MNEHIEKIIKYHEVLDLMRAGQNKLTVETLRETLNMSRPAADKAVRELSNCLGNNITKNDIAHFMGISCGSEHTRVVICNLALEPIKRDDLTQKYGIDFSSAGQECDDALEESGFSFKTPDSFLKLQELIKKIVSIILDVKSETFHLMAIGFAVAGPVNYDEGTWLYSSRIKPICNTTIAELVGYENFDRLLKKDIFFSIDNNAKTTAISEYQALYKNANGTIETDTATLYVGSGLGLGVILGNRLVRGTKNFAGEIGHATYAYEEDRLITNENYMKDNHLFSSQIIDCEATQDFDFLVGLINTISCILGVDRVILTGHSIAKKDRFLQLMRDRKTIYTSYATQHSCRIEAGRSNVYTAAIGAAIEAYFCMCKYNPEHDDDCRINLAKDISWKKIKQTDRYGFLTKS